MTVVYSYFYTVYISQFVIFCSSIVNGLPRAKISFSASNPRLHNVRYLNSEQKRIHFGLFVLSGLRFWQQLSLRTGQHFHDIQYCCGADLTTALFCNLPCYRSLYEKAEFIWEKLLVPVAARSKA
jgi:hypothetical protein